MIMVVVYTELFGISFDKAWSFGLELISTLDFKQFTYLCWSVPPTCTSPFLTACQWKSPFFTESIFSSNKFTGDHLIH